jgi:MFS family permease
MDAQPPEPSSPEDLPETSAADPFAALRLPYVPSFAVGRAASVLGSQFVSVAVGWQLYEQTGDPWSLGLVGIFQLAPVLLLTLPAGNAADRYPRRNLAIGAQLLLALAALGLALTVWLRAPVALVYGLLLAIGAARAVAAPAVSTIMPQLLKPAQFANANAWLASSYQLSAISGPALGGLLIALRGDAMLAFLAAAAGHLLFVVMLATMPAIQPAATAAQRSARDLFAGFAFIRRNSAFLAAMTLDLFAVLLGGAVALLPVFAKDILRVGPVGLGWLRAAPSVGALLMALLSTRLPPWRRPGQALLVTVAGFGIATIGFGLSTSLWLSLLCLFFTGIFDELSVVIRLTLEQVITPDPLRGRVSSLHYVFIGFSNELGSFESGATAALFGPVASVAGGGLGTLAVVALVALLWPSLSRLGPLHTLKPME